MPAFFEWTNLYPKEYNEMALISIMNPFHLFEKFELFLSSIESVRSRITKLVFSKLFHISTFFQILNWEVVVESGSSGELGEFGEFGEFGDYEYLVYLEAWFSNFASLSYFFFCTQIIFSFFAPINMTRVKPVTPARILKAWLIYMQSIKVTEILQHITE